MEPPSARVLCLRKCSDSVGVHGDEGTAALAHPRKAFEERGAVRSLVGARARFVLLLAVSLAACSSVSPLWSGMWTTEASAQWSAGQRERGSFQLQLERTYTA